MDYENIRVRFDKDKLYSDESKKADHEAFIKEIAHYFDLPEYHSKKVLIYFSNCSESFLRSLGRTFIIELDDHRKEIEEKFLDAFEDDGIEFYDFFVVLARDIYLCDDRVFKTITIAHELQHIWQYLSDRCHFLLGRILFYYFSLTDAEYETLIRIPNEYDARRKAKIINYKMHTKSRVDHFFENKISAGNEGEKTEYRFLKDMDVEDKYDLIEDYDHFWNKHGNKIRDQVDKIQKATVITDDEASLLRAYKLFVQECPDINRISNRSV